MDVERWVDQRIGSLEDRQGSKPSAERILARFEARRQRRIAARRRLVRAGVAFTLTVAALAAVGTFLHFRQEAQPVVEIRRPTVPAPQPAAGQPDPAPESVPTPNVTNSVVAPPAVTPPVRNANFKEIGSPTAAIGCEIYTDYECPPCANFYRETVPLLMTQYVNTGKVRLLRRDFPLPFHPHAQLAARYANAAGLIGQFQLVTDRLFETQNDWRQDGDIERQVAPLLGPEKISQLHNVMSDTPRLDEMIAHDMALAADDHIDQTPTVILAANGKRRKVTGIVSFPTIKAAIDELLTQQK